MWPAATVKSGLRVVCRTPGPVGDVAADTKTHVPALRSYSRRNQCQQPFALHVPKPSTCLMTEPIGTMRGALRLPNLCELNSEAWSMVISRVRLRILENRVNAVGSRLRSTAPATAVGAGWTPT